MKIRLLMLSLFISMMAMLLSATLNWCLYDHLVELDRTGFTNAGTIANFPGIPVFFVFADHLANRQYDSPAIQRNVLLLHVSGPVGWGVVAFALTFSSGLLLLESKIKYK